MEEAGVPERTTDHGQATGKRYHLRLRVECTQLPMKSVSITTGVVSSNPAQGVVYNLM